MKLVNHDTWMAQLRAQLPVLRERHDAVQATMPFMRAEDWPEQACRVSLLELQACVNDLLAECDRTDLNHKNLVLNAEGDAVNLEGAFVDRDGALIPEAVPPEAVPPVAMPPEAVPSVAVSPEAVPPVAPPAGPKSKWRR